MKRKVSYRLPNFSHIVQNKRFELLKHIVSVIACNYIFVVGKGSC